MYTCVRVACAVIFMRVCAHVCVRVLWVHVCVPCLCACAFTLLGKDAFL